MTQLINQLIFLAGNLWMAYYHSQLIKANKPIKHGYWAALYLFAVLVWSVIFGWLYAPLLILQRGVVFSPALNLFRRLPINYISSSTTSVIDRIEMWLFKTNWYKREVYYLAGWLAVTILIEVL
jgi:hypothetical protein